MKKSNIITQGFLNLVFVALCLLVIFPFWLLLSVSFSSEADIAAYGYQLFPKNIDLAAYKFVFENPTAIFNAYKVTAAFSILSAWC